MFVFCRPEDSVKMFDMKIASAEEILEGFTASPSSMLLVTGDMSFAAAKTVDMEVWLPGQNRYYEVSSISNCTTTNHVVHRYASDIKTKSGIGSYFEWFGIGNITS